MQYAYRIEPFWLKLFLLALAALLILASLSGGMDPGTGPGRATDPVTAPRLERSGDVEEWTAIESTRPLVRRALARGAILVAYGTEMELTEYRTLVARLLDPDCMGLEDGVRDELLALRGSLKVELARSLGSEANRMLAGLSEERLHEMLARVATVEAPCTFLLDEFAVEVGFADYRYWQVRIARPTVEERLLVRPTAERQVVLPGTKQLYLRLTLRDLPRLGS